MWRQQIAQREGDDVKMIHHRFRLFHCSCSCTSFIIITRININYFGSFNSVALHRHSLLSPDPRGGRKIIKQDNRKAEDP